jgi:hypothetical protein
VDDVTSDGNRKEFLKTVGLGVATVAIPSALSSSMSSRRQQFDRAMMTHASALARIV